MSFRFLMALSCCLVYATTASAGVTFIVDDTDDNKGFKSMSSTSTSCDPSTEHLYNGHCEKNCVGYFSDLTNADSSKGEVGYCTEYGKKKYHYKSCKEGWEQAGEKVTIDGHTYSSKCEAASCGGYYLCKDPENPSNLDLKNFDADAGTILEKKCGNKTYCKQESCAAGWHHDNRGIMCDPDNCVDTPYSDPLDSRIGEYGSCKSGKTTWYGYKSCNEGWRNDLYTNSSPYNGKCIENKCVGYTYTSSELPIPDCAEEESCQKGFVTMYGCAYPISCDECSEYNPTTRTCDHKFKKFCPYYNNNNKGDTVIGIVFDESTRLVMGLEDKGSKTVSGNTVSIWAEYDPSKIVEGDERCVGEPSNLSYNCFSDVPNVKNHHNWNWFDDFNSSYYEEHCGGQWNIVGDCEEGIKATVEQYWEMFNATLLDGDNGLSNTTNIANFAQESGIPHEAAQLCHDETLDGKQWFLPSIGEWVIGLADPEDETLKEYGGVKPDNGGLILALPSKNLEKFNEVSKEYGDALYGSGSGDYNMYWTSTETFHSKYESVPDAWIIHIHESHEGVFVDTDNEWKNRPSVEDYTFYKTRCFFKAPE